MAKKHELKFGISLSGGLNEWVPALKIIDVSIFDLVDLPGAIIDSRLKRTSFDTADSDIFKTFSPEKRNFEITSVSDISPATIAGEVADQNSKIINDFVEKIRHSMNELQKLKINTCSLNISPETVFNNEEKREKRVKLLKRITPFLYEYKINLSIPVRIPAVAEINVKTFPSFIREAMSPNIKLALNIYPHEIKNQHPPNELLCPFRFLMNSVNFIYEPEAGNFLVDKLMDPWFDLLEEYQFQGAVMFIPRTSSITIFSREVERISSIIKSRQIQKSKSSGL